MVVRNCNRVYKSPNDLQFDIRIKPADIIILVDLIQPIYQLYEIKQQYHIPNITCKKKFIFRNERTMKHNFGILFTRSLTVSSSTALRLVKETLHHGVNLRKFVIIPHRRLRILTSKIISGWT
ncbi:hypothetical protein RIR_jg25582.t1 [Rhizophagus irregularis DAOM 181602=DAOM 197198]|nr:hypothetical protein RIR_jg25582.t1 [Rhizophagus irregularis DAOM 181602=DAOM 197198]